MRAGSRPPAKGKVIDRLFAFVAALSLRKPWLTLAAWACLLILALPAARRAPSLLQSGSGDIAGSASLRADRLLRADFPTPYSQLLILALRGGRTAEWDSSSLLPKLTQAF